MLQMSTGSGKTVVAAEIVRTARAKGNRVLFVVDAVSLIDQTVERFRQHGLDGIGVVQASHWMTDYDQPIQVASIQTLARRNWPAFDMAIIDEAHVSYKAHRTIMDSDPKRVVIGLSATPWSKGLGHLFDDLIVPVTMRELIDQGYLCGFEVFAPSHPDLSKARVTAGDYNEADLSKVMGDQSLIADVVETWKRLGENKPTLCFCVDREHAATMQQRFIQAGVGCGYIDGNTPSVERADVERQLNEREISVVVNVGCLTKGVDWAVGCIILARPTKSAALAVQMIGRGLRVNPGLGDLILLDHTDTVLRLGFPTDIHRDTLCKAQKGEAQAPAARQPTPPKECPACHRLRTGPAKCACGYAAPTQPSLIEEGKGMLAQLSGGRSERLAAKPKPADKARFWAELQGYCQAKGKPESFALAMFRNKFGEWPHKKHGVEPVAPSVETIRYIQHRNVAYAKGRERRAA